MKAVQYETCIGLEVHVELATKTKIFCGCATRFGAQPNSQTCPVCAGLPGALPVLNKQVVAYALATGLAANCQINQFCRFDRKNYFYPDNPQNYQISQLYLPICYDGGIEIETKSGKKTIGIHEIHMEEDAGKLLHDDDSGCSLVDYNRSGVPLLEIVTEPDLRNAEEVKAFLEKLRLLMIYLEVSDCKMQEGSMRVDVNLSIRPSGQEALGTRTEMKNLNSFRAISRAIDAEQERQAEILKAGDVVILETRRWDDQVGQSFSMRTKEAVQDYRYFPEPDLVPVIISDGWIETVKSQQPELPDARMKRYQTELGIPAYDAGIITASKQVADLFEAAAAICQKPKQVSNWIMGELLRLLKERELEAADIRFTAADLAALIELTEAGVITGTVAKEIFIKMFDDGIKPAEYVKSHGLQTVCDVDVLRDAAAKVIADNPKSVADYRNGKEKAIGFLIGQTMKALGGKGDPALVKQLIKELLE